MKTDDQFLDELAKRAGTRTVNIRLPDGSAATISMSENEHQRLEQIAAERNQSCAAVLRPLISEPG